MKKNRVQIIFILTALLLGKTNGQQNTLKPDWSYFQFLIGAWSGDGGGNPGQGSGSFTFSLDLEDHILVRHNRSDYPASKSRLLFLIPT